jgi:CheY-like chemotaxis protein
VRKQGDMLDISVIDRGPGIDAAFLPRLFVAYERQDRHKATAGTGLGLAISKKLMGSMNGTIAYTTTDGLSTFVVRLPLADAITLDDSIGPQQPTSSSANLFIDTPAVRAIAYQQVLLVEDNALNQRVLTKMLVRHGVDTQHLTVVENGCAALEYLLRLISTSNHVPVLVLLDLSMPLLQGEDVALTWRDLAHRASLPRSLHTIVAVSARSVAASHLKHKLRLTIFCRNQSRLSRRGFFCLVCPLIATVQG